MSFDTFMKVTPKELILSYKGLENSRYIQAHFAACIASSFGGKVRASDIYNKSGEKKNTGYIDQFSPEGKERIKRLKERFFGDKAE